VKLGADGDGGRRSAARFRPGCGSTELDDGRRRFGARLRSSGCVEIDRGDELGQRNVDGEVCSLPLAAPRKEKGGTGRDRTGTFEAFARIRAPTPRSGAIADAWTSSPAATAAVWAAYVHSVEQEKHSGAQ